MSTLPSELTALAAEHPCRFSQEEKSAFLLSVKRLLRQSGYSENEITEQRCSDIFGTRNLIFGNPDAEYVITAHYDTPGKNGFLLGSAPILGQTGANILMLLSCLPLIALEVLLVRIAASQTSASFLSIAGAILSAPLLLVLLTVVPMLFRNRSNCNDNTSGTLCVLLCAMLAASDSELKKKCCFVLFDNEEWGLIGSNSFASYRSKRGTDPGHSFFINLDSIGVGDVFAAVRACSRHKKGSSRYSALIRHLSDGGIPADEKCSQLVFLSDHAVFPDSVMLSRMRRSRLGPHYIPNIHSAHDTECDYNYISELAHTLYEFIRNQTIH